MFRFTIRDVLWLTVVVALALGWLIAIHQRNLKAREAESFHALAELLTAKLKAKNPAARIEIIVNGKSIVADAEWN